MNCRKCSKPHNYADPFCSAACCRAWYGVTTSAMTSEELSELNRQVRHRALYSGSLAEPVGAVMLEARQRDMEARKRLGLAA